MKRLLSLLLCLLLILTALTACGEDTRRDDDDDDRKNQSRPSIEKTEDKKQKNNSAAITIDTFDGLQIALKDEWTTALRLQNRTYGMDKLNLSPCRLNSDGSAIDRNAPLIYPLYGSDGRVYAVSTATSTGAYDKRKDQFVYTAEPTAVSVIGSAVELPDSDAKVPLTAIYGYILDLQLSTDSQRILTLPTEGISGSMSFTISENCSEAEIEGWASAFRMVFFDPTGTILGIAFLDVGHGRIEKNVYVMPLALHHYSVDETGILNVLDSIPDGALCTLPAGESAVSALVYIDADHLPSPLYDHYVDIDAELNIVFR